MPRHIHPQNIRLINFPLAIEAMQRLKGLQLSKFFVIRNSDGTWHMISSNCPMINERLRQGFRNLQELIDMQSVEPLKDKNRIKPEDWVGNLEEYTTSVAVGQRKLKLRLKLLNPSSKTNMRILRISVDNPKEFSELSPLYTIPSQKYEAGTLGVIVYYIEKDIEGNPYILIAQNQTSHMFRQIKPAEVREPLRVFLTAAHEVIITQMQKLGINRAYALPDNIIKEYARLQEYEISHGSLEKDYRWPYRDINRWRKAYIDIPSSLKGLDFLRGIFNIEVYEHIPQQTVDRQLLRKESCTIPILEQLGWEGCHINRFIKNIDKDNLRIEEDFTSPLIRAPAYLGALIVKYRFKGARDIAERIILSEKKPLKDGNRVFHIEALVSAKAEVPQGVLTLYDVHNKKWAWLGAKETAAAINVEILGFQATDAICSAPPPEEKDLTDALFLVAKSPEFRSQFKVLFDRAVSYGGDLREVTGFLTKHIPDEHRGFIKDARHISGGEFYLKHAEQGWVFDLKKGDWVKINVTLHRNHFMAKGKIYADFYNGKLDLWERFLQEHPDTREGVGESILKEVINKHIADDVERIRKVQTKEELKGNETILFLLAGRTDEKRQPKEIARENAGENERADRQESREPLGKRMLGINRVVVLLQNVFSQANKLEGQVLGEEREVSPSFKMGVMGISRECLKIGGDAQSIKQLRTTTKENACNFLVKYQIDFHVLSDILEKVGFIKFKAEELIKRKQQILRLVEMFEIRNYFQERNLYVIRNRTRKGSFLPLLRGWMRYWDQESFGLWFLRASYWYVVYKEEDWWKYFDILLEEAEEENLRTSIKRGGPHEADTIKVRK
ncbi:MAG: hypothetical protein WCH62_07105 [Candidatus Omnitrophota bacterium]